MKKIKFARNVQIHAKVAFIKKMEINQVNVLVV
jgi:hypothetical protein